MQRPKDYPHCRGRLPRRAGEIQAVDTYEAVWMGVEENDIETLKGLPEFERVYGIAFSFTYHFAKPDM